ncbi:hypothetical protein [Sporosarcina limicola]|uniref:Uncharacterized protein n=1 Tax=Sporosarcina limicola TaxID=34101 RepID=A0A927R7M2_9BACL|nr:hypothetical protein [Sporosarcina limicola]MBE1556139.1 hypothetical protein [Sporosarcina limicola]
MLGNWHVPCGAGEKLEITSNAYLLLRLVEERCLTCVQQSGTLVEYSISEMINLYYKKPYTEMKNRGYDFL